jgi:hypothetical protein
MIRDWRGNMGSTAGESGTVPSGTNIYEQYILPCIESAQPGDELLYISPSTFFGFYSLGARNFHTVCDALKAAKARGVQIRLLVDVHDAFTAKAAEGLVSFLLDKRDIRNFAENVNIYMIMVHSKQGKSRYVEFSSREPQALQYLPGIQSRPFGPVTGEQQEMSEEIATAKVKFFNDLWEKATSVNQVIATFTPFYRARRYVTFYQAVLNIASAAVGLLIGVTLVIQDQPHLSVATLLIYVIAGIGSGILTNFISNMFTSRLFK